MFKKGNIVRFKCGFWGDIKSPETGKLGVIEEISGGYVTMPVIFAAKKLGIKTVLHEQNSIPGKTNKFLSKNVDLVCTSYENSNRFFTKAKKCIYTGNPAGENSIKTKEITKESLGLHKNKELLLIVAGSLGSESINNFFLKFLSKVNENDNFEVLYITGKNYYDDFINGRDFSKNIKIIPFLDNMSGLLRNVDLIISRAGASTLSEIIASKVPSILIPSPNVAENHQYYNAKTLADNNAAILIEEKDLTGENLINAIKSIIDDKEKLKQMGENAKKTAVFDANDRICDVIMNLYNSK